MSHDTQASSHTSLPAIFARLCETKRGLLPRILAQQFLKLSFSPEDGVRMHELAQKTQQGTISSSESEELNNFVDVGDMLAILQSRARRTLLRKKSNTARNG
jgi:hypothetical protein